MEALNLTTEQVFNSTKQESLPFEFQPTLCECLILPKNRVIPFLLWIKHGAFSYMAILQLGFLRA